MINCRRDVHYTYAGIQAQLLAMHLDDPEKLPKETMPTPESMVKGGWAKRCPNHPGKFIAGDKTSGTVDRDVDTKPVK